MVLMLNLKPELEQRLRQEAEERGIPAEDYAVSVLEESVAQSSESTTSPRLIDLANRARAGVPPEEWDRAPSDRAMNYKHYLYGHPKLEE